MKAHFLELPTQFVFEDPRFPDRDERHIYEHLKYSCSKFFPLPAIFVDFVGGRLVVVGGHKYLKAAQDLGYPWVRAVYRDGGQEPENVLAKLPPGARFTPRETLEREHAATVARDYHVYFFDAPLSPTEQTRFRQEVTGFFERLDTPLIEKGAVRVSRWAFPFEGLCAEFEALIPVGDPSWVTPYLRVCQRFSREVKRIVSFQGARFPEE